MKANTRRHTEMPESEQTLGTTEIDETIGRIEKLYQVATGRPVAAGDAPHAAIPPEKDPAQHIEEQLNRLLNLFGDAGFAKRPAPPAWIPAMSVWESETEIRICMDLPGVAREEVEILQQGKVLTVKGSRAVPRENGMRLCSNEFPFGAFQRTVLVPSGALTTEPSAEMKNGVLEIRIRKESIRNAEPKPVRVN